MNDIPDWAGKRACELLNGDNTGSIGWYWPESRHSPSLRTVAKLVMQLEQPPIDPDEEAVKRILAAWSPSYDEALFTLISDRLARAVSQYKQEKANG